MELLGEINDKILGIDNPIVKKYSIKKSARAILFNEDNKIAIIYVSKDNYHKLPGGSFEGDENFDSALKREILEETGFEVKSIEKEVGMVLEFRNDKNWEALFINYCVIAKTDGIGIEQAFTDYESEHGFELKWMGLDEAISILSNENPDCYNGKFIVPRELMFLKKAKEILNT